MKRGEHAGIERIAGTHGVGYRDRRRADGKLIAFGQHDRPRGTPDVAVEEGLAHFRKAINERLEIGPGTLILSNPKLVLDQLELELRVGCDLGKLGQVLLDRERDSLAGQGTSEGAVFW